MLDSVVLRFDLPGPLCLVVDQTKASGIFGQLLSLVVLVALLERRHVQKRLLEYTEAGLIFCCLSLLRPIVQTCLWKLSAISENGLSDKEKDSTAEKPVSLLQVKKALDQALSRAENHLKSISAREIVKLGFEALQGKSVTELFLLLQNI